MRRIVIVIVAVLVVAVALVALTFLWGRGPAPVAKAAPDAAVAPARVETAPPPAPRVDAAPAEDTTAVSPTAAAHARPAGPREPHEPRTLPEEATAPRANPKPPTPQTPPPEVDAGPAPAPTRRFDPLEAPPPMTERKLARVTARHHSRMGSTYVLQKVTYELDGQKVFDRQDLSGALDRARDFDTFDRTIEPGRHVLAVRLLYRGSGFGVFSYLQGYHFNVHADYTFTANPGRLTEISVEAIEKRGASLRLEDRPLITFTSHSAEDRPSPQKR